MYEKRFNGKIERLRAPERVARLEVERVVGLCLGDSALKSVLDVGVGSGLFAEAFYRRSLNVSGLDANPDMIPAAQQYVPEGDFRVGSAEAMPYADAAFDLVFFGLILHETDDQLKALQEAHRVARQRVCVLEWPYLDHETFGPPLAHRVSPAVITDLVKRAGYSGLEEKPLSYLNLYIMEV